MSHQFTISELGLRLIKAYEGYRAESREMISGERVIGFGHRLADQDIILLTPQEAEMLLREDIKPIEEMVNETIFAPLTQGQFDALCSLAYNIGPDAFLTSDVVKAINNGRPIDAADGFDVWRKGEIHGEVLVIDALVRRRTAEKALFLKPMPAAVTSPRDSLPPLEDDNISSMLTPPRDIFTPEDGGDYTGPVPYEVGVGEGRRREDGPAGILELSEYEEEDNQDIEDELGFVPRIDLEAITQNVEPQIADDIDEDQDALVLSPIAEAAAEVSTRLDALIDDIDTPADDLSDLPDALIDAPRRAASNTESVILPFKKDGSDDEADEVIGDDVLGLDNQADAIEGGFDAADNDWDEEAAKPLVKPAGSGADADKSIVAYGIMLLSGLVILGLSFYTWLNDPLALLGEVGPIAALAGIIMGGVIIFASIWYILKSGFNKS